MTHAKLQHYVPKFLLKGFTHGKKNKLYVFDKLSGKSFTAKPKNVAAEHGFYDIEMEGYRLTIEPSLAKLESQTSAIIREIRAKESIKFLTIEERVILSRFIAVQYLRTNHLRTSFIKINEKLASHLKALGAEPENVMNFSYLTGEDLKALTASMIVDHSNEFTKHIIEKDWILTKTTEGNPFIISDHPVTLHNEYDYGLIGNIGFAVKGIEINLPINDILSLYLICPTIGNDIRKAKENVEAKIKHLSRSISKEAQDRLTMINKLYKSLVYSEPLELYPENVLHKNSLQVAYSNRWIFTSDGDFGLVKEMLKENPNLNVSVQ